MSTPKWIKPLSRPLGTRPAHSRRPPRSNSRQRRGLRLQQLEHRFVPTTLDLSAFAGQTGMINGAIFTGSTGHNTSGSGVIDSFVRLDNSPIEQGYNTDARPYTPPNDAGNTANFNK